ncbi:DUF2474 domain-containing protein [Bordetella genomosp. 9]|uniref:DUF2474 domain-containing protein n=2 Tax=Bordetella TaxID=517 RepID=A0A261R5I6_9BORD|nr:MULTISPECIES: DUF2474 domain-containing protein [Bordetella]ARP83112.1 DUF2474 domain-containing protein [Bordetella genomosp. 8]OZI19902.1 DUF2474 domain-containing protein [Bordetella genomosp. 9]
MRIWKRLAWLIVIWAASVAVLGGVALIVRWMMSAAGLTLH